jgi:hypothetical protein
LLLLADSLCFLSSLILFNENGRDWSPGEKWWNYLF